MKSTKKGIALVSSVFVLFAALFVSAFYVVPAFADGVVPSDVSAAHTSTVVVSPGLIAPSTGYTFAVTVTNNVSSTANITEFRIYNYTNATSNPNEFLNFACLPLSGWNGPYSLATSGDPYCFYTATTHADEIAPGQSVIFGFAATSPATDSCRSYRFDTRAGDQTWYPPVYPVCVDAQAPMTNQTFGGPYYNNDGIEYIDGVSTVILTPWDPQPHPSDVNKTYYAITLLDEEDEGACFSEEACEGLGLEDEFIEYTGPISGIEESCHVIEYYSTDLMGNRELTKRNCFFVDKTPPVLTKSVGNNNVFGDEVRSVELTGERINETQNNDGGWDWITPDTDKTTILPSPNNTLGVTAQGMLDAYRMDGSPSKLAACIDTYNTMVFYSGLPTPSDHRIRGPDVSFLVELSEVTGDSTYANFARTRYIATRAEFGSGTATGLAEFIRNRRLSYPSLISWDINLYVQGALALNRYFPGQGFDADAAAMTEVIYDSLYVPTVDFNLSNQIQNDYWLSHTGAIEAFTSTSLHLAQRNSLVTSLLANQYGDGHFVSVNGSSTQTTAYAIIALLKAGQRTAAENAVNYLVNNQNINGGWIEGADGENTEADSEAAQAMSDFVGIYTTWVTQNTNITFTCADQQPHPSGNEQTCYKVFLTDGAPFDNTSAYCSGSLTDGYCCVPAGVQTPLIFKFKEESNHKLQYFCQDAVQKKTDVLTQNYKVDTTAPTISKDMFGTYTGDCPHGTYINHGDCYVEGSGSSGVHVDATDGGTICAVDNVQCGYGLWWMTDMTNCTAKYGTSAWDGYKCRVANGFFGEEGVNINFTEDSAHRLYVDCWDALGNAMPQHMETFQVDNTPPVTTKSFIGAQFPSDGDAPGVTHWITSDTDVVLSSTDNKVGVEARYYKVTLLGSDAPCESADACAGVQTGGEFMMYEEPFQIGETSCHIVEYYSTDLFGHRELTKRQCVFVDNDAPATTKTIGTPMVNNSGDVYITSATPITLSCEDYQLHPVDHVSLFYRYKYAPDCDGLDEVSMPDFSEDQTSEIVIRFPEQSCHQLEWYCADVLGNAEPARNETDRVDNTAPQITTVIDGPMEGACPELQFGPDAAPQFCYIDGVTRINVTAVDPTPHPVDNVRCNWTYTFQNTTGTYVGNESGINLQSPFQVHFPEESLHFLTITCKDALGNTEVKEEAYRVDKTPPVTSSNLGDVEPYEEYDGTEWITSATPITLSVEDAGPHKSGIQGTSYRVTLVDDTYCYNQIEDMTPCSAATGSGNWLTYTGTPFTIGERSCHLLEYNSIDNVDKNETVKKECVFVDNEAPVTVKTVGTPSTKLFSNQYNWTYYPYVNGRCWAGENPIDCWKVTTMTPVTMNCTDVEPHPVDHSFIYFQVDFDGDDKTLQYCNEYGGQMNIDGYCVVNNAPLTIGFHEESEHNLKYYCADSLGNVGALDDEKFKVEGTAFTINLNKKWNLISVPFVLQDDVMNDIFKPIENQTVAVWSFDGTNWHVYTPGDGPDDITTMVPGEGYWVLNTAPANLTIGGSLFSPGKTPPSKNIVKGWNLIGYYSNEDGSGNSVFSYAGPVNSTNPVGKGRNPMCELGSLVDTTVGYPEWSSLWTYWEPFNDDNNNQTSLWIPVHTNDRMDAGAGYWLEINVPESYSPSTMCP